MGTSLIIRDRALYVRDKGIQNELILQERHHDLGGTDYIDIRQLSPQEAVDMVASGKASWLFGKPSWIDDAITLLPEPTKPIEPAIRIWSNERGGWWKPGGYGYTTDIGQAGTFTQEKAVEIIRQSRVGWDGQGTPPETIMIEIKV